MKTIKVIEEKENEGFVSLLGKRAVFYCLNYIYAGDVVGVNDTYVKLENAYIVYETGDHSAKEWKDAQKLPSPRYVMVSAIESFEETGK